MLSGETSVGVDPDKCCQTMEKIIRKTEIFRKPVLNVLQESKIELQALCKSAITLANDINAKSIVTLHKNR